MTKTKVQAAYCIIMLNLAIQYRHEKHQDTFRYFAAGYAEAGAVDCEAGEPNYERAHPGGVAAL
jgi:hypothetical protein